MAVMTLLFISGLTGTVLSSIQILIPVIMIYKMFKSNDASKIPFTLFIISIILSYFWLVYGMLILAIPIIITNLFAFIANATYLLFFIAYINKERQTKTIYLLATMFLIPVICIGLYLSIPLHSNAYGIAAAVVNCLLFFTPLQNIVKVFKERDHSYIHLELSIVMLLSSITWVIYGITNSFSLPVIIPNIIGCTLMILQISVWVCYYVKNYNKPKENDDEEKRSNATSGNDIKSYDTIDSSAIEKVVE